MSFSKIVEFALSKVGCGYIYGATGWVCTLKRRLEQAAQYPEYADTILGTGAKWDGKQCYDCAQLVRRALAQIGIKAPSGATSQWKANIWADKGEISTLPDEAGIILYRQTADKKMQHTGIYVGGGEAVEARGHKDGVIRSLLSKYPWTHWAKPNPALAENKDDEKEIKQVNRTAVVTKIQGASGSTVNFRDRPSTNGVVLDTIPFGTRVNVTSEQGEWSGFEYKGKAGWMLTKFLPDAGAAPASQPDGSMISVDRVKLVAIYQELGQLLGE